MLEHKFTAAFGRKHLKAICNEILSADLNLAISHIRFGDNCNAHQKVG